MKSDLRTMLENDAGMVVNFSMKNQILGTKSLFLLRGVFWAIFDLDKRMPRSPSVKSPIH
jgi:hypothetical protein